MIEDAIRSIVAAAVADTLQPRLMTLETAARYLDMTPEALRAKVALGIFPTVRLDAKLRFDRTALDRVIDSAQ